MSAGFYRTRALADKPDKGKLLAAYVYFRIPPSEQFSDVIAHILVSAHAVATGRRSRASLQNLAMHSWDAARPKYGPEAAAPTLRPDEISDMADAMEESMTVPAVDTDGVTLPVADIDDDDVLLLPSANHTD